MSIETILIILVVVFLLGGGGWYFGRGLTSERSLAKAQAGGIGNLFRMTGVTIALSILSGCVRVRQLRESACRPPMTNGG
jgi:hypothetical protein